MALKVLSLYCGGGGIDEGLKKAGIKTTLAIDVDPNCIDTIKLNHDCETIVGKVNDHFDSFGNFDIVVGGPPCPEFSVAKTDRTLDDTEVKNFWQVVRDSHAKFWLMENVPGVIEVCKERNYLLNCADFGTPQTRLRRFFTKLPRPKETHSNYPSETLFGDPIKKWVSVEEALNLRGTLEDRKTVFGDYDKDMDFRSRSTSKTSFTILSDARAWFVSPSGFSTSNQKELSRSIKEPSKTIVNATDYNLTTYKIYSMKYLRHRNPMIFDKHPPTKLNEPAKTIMDKDRNPKEYLTDGHVARKLTNDELQILQGFPKDYKFSGTKTSIRSQIGNAVPSQPVQSIFDQIKVLN